MGFACARERALPSRRRHREPARLRSGSLDRPLGRGGRRTGDPGRPPTAILRSVG